MCGEERLSVDVCDSDRCSLRPGAPGCCPTVAQALESGSGSVLLIEDSLEGDATWPSRLGCGLWRVHCAVHHCPTLCLLPMSLLYSSTTRQLAPSSLSHPPPPSKFLLCFGNLFGYLHPVVIFIGQMGQMLLLLYLLYWGQWETFQVHFLFE